MLQNLLTETRNAASASIDRLPTAEMMAVIDAADADVPGAVAKVIPEIAAAVDGIVPRLREGGRLFYIGAGTSGRLGLSTLPNVRRPLACRPALCRASSPGEIRLCAIRSKELRTTSSKENRIWRRGPLPQGSCWGIAASGRTPYVLGAIEYARALGSLTIGLSCMPRVRAVPCGPDRHHPGARTGGNYRLDAVIAPALRPNSC